ncbi:MAG: 16S rRNA (guanine(527)-N(7))-methyltransferase RsmG [Deltaproteobacteria bacterium]|nr:16S rRNA (guanine(527)-N(7))-methyltransferase RsmG [Candidatus Anaeroferrophillus wilburensis]MBN2889170.1 16S rRNA (guanine(527)-N(7))-methyltransferase RsmG [Deltaproteobacteria bacterium]
MKKSDLSPPIALLVRGAEELGISLGVHQQKAFAVYLAALQRWNKTYNLTAIHDPLEMVSRHFLDSLAFIHGLRGVEGTVLDLGSGAGFPGLPLALVMPGHRFYLVDARRKKTFFLHHVVRTLGLENVMVIHLHLQPGNGSTEIKHPVAALVSRAVSAPDVVLPVAGEVVVPGGRLVFSATASSQKNIIAALSRYQGRLQLMESIDVAIPFLDLQRHLLVIGRSENPDG